MYEYLIMYKYKNFEAEEVDSAEDKQEAENLLSEYRMAYGSEGKLWIKKVKI